MTKGSRLCKADLHVHTPASHDYQDTKATGNDIVKAAIAKDLDILAITDHNSADFLDHVRAAARGFSLTVIPGVEVTTPEGHILALFDAAIKETEVSDFLIRIGIPRNEHGKEEAISEKHAEDVIRQIHEMGGVAIAAHANEKAIGLLQQKGQYKLRVVPMIELAALEFTRREDVEKFSQGRVSQHYPKKTCTQSSDAHSLVEIGNRVTYLKMDEQSVYGIRQALLDPTVRVRFSWDLRGSSHPRIVSLRVDQGFFDGQEFSFHENLNCLVGGQGTGKSTVIELLRYAFGDVSPFEHIAADHAGKLEKLVGDGGQIEIIYQDSDGDLKRVTREVQSWETSREVHDMAGNPTSLLSAPVLFSQGELVETARNRMAQLELLDRHLDIAEENRSEKATTDALSTNARQIVQAGNAIAKLTDDIAHPETGLAVSKSKHEDAKTKLKDPVLQQFPRWKAEQRVLDEMRD
ncbi:MAG: AAA family ATPase [Gemmatimonadota bacterium]|nr:AAA family ATPase [Gemmatimonadota bacterium]